PVKLCKGTPSATHGPLPGNEMGWRQRGANPFSCLACGLGELLGEPSGVILQTRQGVFANDSRLRSRYLTLTGRESSNDLGIRLRLNPIYAAHKQKFLIPTIVLTDESRTSHALSGRQALRSI